MATDHRPAEHTLRFIPSIGVTVPCEKQGRL